MFELSYTNVFLFISFIFTGLYFWNKHVFGYWKRRGVYSPPTQFLIGHLGPVALGRQSLGVRMKDLYTQTKDHAYVGLQLSAKKTLLINDLDMAKTILLKDFDHFSSHGIKQNKENNPLGEHLFNLDGERWKKMRVKLTPTFTSSKMKFMFDTMLSCSHEMIEFINKTVEAGSVSDIKEIIARFGTDVIGSCAFGIQTNSFKHPDAEFRRMGKKFFEASFLRMVLNTFVFIAPGLVPQFLRKRAIGDVAQFFIKTVNETIAHRENNHIVRNDFLQLLIDMKNSDEKSGNHLTIEEIVPQVFVFFIAGFETSSTAATYAFLELAKNKHVQEKAREHIDKAFEECDGKITYETINQLSYLSQIVNESLRMYPPLPFLFRNCTKDYKIAGTDTVIEKGTMIAIPIMGIQRNSDIYPDPLQFDPDRFSPENVSQRHQYSHLPFGEGPRICIGSRFGMMQVKLALFTILRSFRVDLVAESSGPVKFDPRAFLLHTDGEMLLKFTPR